jgi:hypothetical protein
MSNKPKTKGGGPGGMVQGVGLEFKSQYCKKKNKTSRNKVKKRYKSTKHH